VSDFSLEKKWIKRKLYFYNFIVFESNITISLKPHGRHAKTKSGSRLDNRQIVIKRSERKSNIKH